MEKRRQKKEEEGEGKEGIEKDTKTRKRYFILRNATKISLKVSLYVIYADIK